MASSGLVSFWSVDEGWGVIESPDTPSGCWFQYSDLWALRYPPLTSGESIRQFDRNRSAVVGEQVEFWWEKIQQDDYIYRAVNVQPRRMPPRREIEYSVGGVVMPWPSDRFGELPYSGLWTDAFSRTMDQESS